MRATGNQRDVAPGLGQATTDDGSDRPGAEHHISDALMRWLKEAVPGSAR